MSEPRTTEQYAAAIQADLHDGQSLNEEYLTLVKWLVRIQRTVFAGVWKGPLRGAEIL